MMVKVIIYIFLSVIVFSNISAKSYVACYSGGKVDFFNMKGQKVSSYKLTQVPSGSPRIKGNSIVYVNKGNDILIEDFISRKVETLKLDASFHEMIDTRRHLLNCFDLSNDKKKIAFIKVHKETFQTNRSLASEFNSLYYYDLSKKELELIDNQGYIVDVMFFKGDVLYVNTGSIFVYKIGVGKKDFAPKIKEILEVKSGHCFLPVQETKKGFIFEMRKWDGCISFGGLYDYDFENNAVIHQLNFKEFSKKYFTKTNIKKVSHGWQYLVFSDWDRSGIILIDFKNIKEYVLSNDIGASVDIVPGIPNKKKRDAH